MKNICLVCGYEDLYEPPYQNDAPSYEICPCCGFQYGYDDFPDKNSSIAEWRSKWILNGYKWFSSSRTQPYQWDAKKQIESLTKEN